MSVTDERKLIDWADINGKLNLFKFNDYSYEIVDVEDDRTIATLTSLDLIELKNAIRALTATVV